VIADLFREAVRELGLEGRGAVERAVELLGGPGVVVLRAPTGYGKSFASVALGYALYRAYKEGSWRELGGISKAIHVLPMASIVEDLYRRALERLLRQEEPWRALDCNDRPARRTLRDLEADFGGKFGERWVGCQAWSLESDFRDPLFIYSTLVYATFDSFVLNLFKVTPLPRRRAPYEAARSAVMRALVLLDEAHLLAEPGGGAREGATRELTALRAALTALADLKAPVLVMTATIPDSLVRLIAPGARVVTALNKECGREGDDVVKDYEPRGEVHARLEEGVDYVGLAKSYTGLKLFVFNTVRRAVRAYEELRRHFDAVLLHGRLSLGDRSNAVERLGELQRCGGVVVATQVVEAGVNLDAQLLVTDVAPLPSLIQRMGRAARERVSSADVYIVSDGEALEDAKRVYGERDVEITLELLRGRAGPGKSIDVNWRDPCPDDGDSYAALLDKYGGAVYGAERPPFDGELLTALTALSSLAIMHRRDAERHLERFCGFVRDSAAVPVVVSLDCLKRGRWRDCIVLLSLDHLRRKRNGAPLYGEVLERRGGKFQAVVQGEIGGKCEDVGGGLHLCGVELDLENLARACRQLLRLESGAVASIGGGVGRIAVVGLLAREGSYISGIGFRADYG